MSESNVRLGIIKTDKGIKETKAAIERILREKGPEFFKEMQEYMNYTMNLAKQICPVDTGALMLSIRIAQIGTTPKGYSMKGADLAFDYQLVAGGPPYINPKHKRFVDYAQAVHDGTIYREPRPFLTDAASQAEPKLKEIMERYADFIATIWSEK